MLLADVYKFFAKDYTQEQVEAGLKQLKISSRATEVDEEVIDQLKAILSDNKALPGTSKITTAGKSKPTKRKTKIETQRIDASAGENQANLIKAFEAKGVSEAEALIAIQQNAFLLTLQESGGEFYNNLINKIIEDVIKAKKLQNVSLDIVERNKQPENNQTVSERVAIAQNTVDVNWQEVLDNSDSFDWQEVLGV